MTLTYYTNAFKNVIIHTASSWSRITVSTTETDKNVKFKFNFLWAYVFAICVMFVLTQKMGRDNNGYIITVITEEANSSVEEVNFTLKQY
jgi:hypothetical protein